MTLPEQYAYELGQLQVRVKSTILFLERLKLGLTEPQSDVIDSINKSLQRTIDDGSERIKLAGEK